jgi:hypothetical protein
MLILKTKKSNYREWYEKNKQKLSEKRKRRYAEDAEYRARAIETSRKRRSGEQTPPIPPVPPDAPISLKEAALRVPAGASTVRGWLRQNYFPEPKRHNRGLWFTEKQVELLRLLKEFFRKNKMRPLKITQPLLAQLRASIIADWN